MNDLSYKEKLDKLQVRIRAHKAFANFDISDWITEYVNRAPRRTILDLGCGSGNHLSIYLDCVGPGGTVTGLDREAALIEDARRAHPDAKNLTLCVGSMDERLSFEDGTFDLCLSNFAIYNAISPVNVVRELYRVLADGGELVVTGPTKNNARELYFYNERLTGRAIDEITLVRTDRIRQEILPIVQDTFADVRVEVLNSNLTFPTGDEFLRYFRATQLFEEIAEKRGITETEMQRALPQETNIIVSKEMIAVVARK